MSFVLDTIIVMNISIRYSKRAKNMSLVVHPDGRCEVVVPARRPPSERVIKRFVVKHGDWIERHTLKAATRVPAKPLSHQGIPRKRVEEQTLRLIEETIIAFRRHQPFTVNHVRLGNYKSQWGSCSSGFTLGFHYKLSLLPRHLADYVVAHELCHTIHFNHSKTFWALVGTLCGDPKIHRKELKDYTL